jgi:hypothetical protein
MDSHFAPTPRRPRQPGRVLVVFLAGVLGVAGTAFAGPPLLCHPFDIDGARSLPWDGSSSWFDGDDTYKVTSLVADTESLLGPTTPVIVRMETLRRAAIYAGTDPAVARQLVNRFLQRAADPATPDALEIFDAAYVVEAFRQLAMVTQFKAHRAALEELVAGKDGYQMVKKSLQLRPDDASLEFAAALFAASKDRRVYGTAYESHAGRARAGANGNALLARNIRQLG